ncbi:AI-2E family transporter [Polymorphobacter fuscus]|uniref:AI-2E family transporter n=1 Tax=Sandarakinorhabdus fusca TaxID=1439888 RepID=A0A7C9GQV8_9SPHN|nr:AI-2E family transporter [Polymorphobacter fuscus]KAB7645585.1 AI-2E family transporter [Polymorphobacter fuscus]MQT18033.1 AI-2E family transporter [Polymorphobacter fuscus]NJC08666.1 putative PurR-regulated permease PerM [Polymorphobacter fuscus]
MTTDEQDIAPQAGTVNNRVGHGPQADDRASGRLFRRTMVVLAAIATGLVSWLLLQLILLLFASMLVGVMLYDFARALMRWTRLPFYGALTLAVILPLITLIIVFGLFGSIMYDQFASLAADFPRQLKSATEWLQSSGPGREAIKLANSYAPKMESIFGFAQYALLNIGSAASGLAIILVAGVYLAAQPALYVDGLVAMMTPAREIQVRRALDASHGALTAWLKGQAIGMAFVALGTSIGLSVIGMPSGLALGLVAGLCEFVPYLGVILVSVPAIIIGFGIDAQTGWLTVAVLVVVQQLQGNVVQPLAQRRLSDLPPALTIFSLIGFGMLCGPMGVVLAVPLTVVALALVKGSQPAGRM